jgi:hypothetical protein
VKLGEKLKNKNLAKKLSKKSCKIGTFKRHFEGVNVGIFYAV